MSSRRGNKDIRNETLRPIIAYYIMNGEDKTVGHFKISHETLGRYVRLAKQRKVLTKTGNLLSQIAQQYTEAELKALTEGRSILHDGRVAKAIHDFTGETVTIGAMTDTHFGSKYTNPEFIYDIFEEFRKEKVDMVVISGDVTDGLNKRIPDHIYQQTHVGYHAQKEHAIEVLEQWTDSPIYMIDGNHDRWYIKSAGAKIVSDICDALPDAKFLGHDEGDIWLSKKARLRLWHGEDGSSYAISYRLQKVVESFTGGDKPNMLLAGHVHKCGYFFIRHVHCWGTGCVQRQTAFMRSKRLAAHPGFWLVRATINKRGIGKVQHTFYPFYV